MILILELVNWDFYLDFSSGVSNSRFLSWLNVDIESRNKHCMERKKGGRGYNRMILIYLNVINRII